MKKFQSIFPYNQKVIAEYPLMPDEEIEAMLALSENVFYSWRDKTFIQRADIFLNVAKLLKQKKESLAAIITNEMGKLTKEAIAEVEKCALACEYFAAHAEEFLKDEIYKTNYKKSFAAFQPIGAVLAIMPWNFPFWQVFRFAAPALMAGNIALLKHAPNVCGCALAIQDLFEEAGAEKGVFQTVIADVDVTEKILQHDIVQGLSLTGSERAGSSAASIASKHIKKSVLELGGSDCFIVLTDADIQKAAQVAVTSRMQNTGQSCIAAKRFLIVKDVLDDFTNAVKNELQKLKPGNPFEKETTFAPMARLDLAENLKRQMDESVAKGAQIILGGEVDGCNYQPTLLTNVQQGMPAFDEETFGPLFCVIKVNDEKEAIELANNSRFGLGGNIWTKDIDKGVSLARKIDSGSVFINSMVKSEPALPFGGIKKSGFGRELSNHGIMEFVNVKTITVSE
jgi:succinate-semialdehyde dehydrogenase/glutarate-semialdehyde dehydrogenase